MSLEGAPKQVCHIKAFVTIPDDAGQRQTYSGRALEIALTRQHDMPFAASAAILSDFLQMESYEVHSLVFMGVSKKSNISIYLLLH